MLKKKSLLQRMEEDDEDMEITNTFQKKQKNDSVIYGKGNAIKGYRNKYKMYPSSDVFARVVCLCVCVFK